MYANQILKQKGLNGSINWKSDGFAFQIESMLSLIEKHHQFYFGEYKDFSKGLEERIKGKRIFMDGLADNLKLPYDAFLLCFNQSVYNITAKFALFVSRFDSEDNGISVEYMMKTSGSKGWMILPFSRLYLFNKTLAEGRNCWSEIEIDPMTDGNSPLYNTNTGIFPYIDREIAKEFIDPSSDIFPMQRTVGAVLNYFLVLYNQRYIVTETVYRNKPKRKKKKNNNRLFDYKILCVSLPKGGKRYRYGESAGKGSKGIMPFTEVPATWKHYSEEGGGMFGNPKLVGDFFIPEHVRGSKQAGFAGKDYCVKTKN